MPGFAIHRHYDWRTRDLRLLKGKVTFIRFVRKSGRITLTAKDKFLIGKKYKWQYVMANVDVAKQKTQYHLARQTHQILRLPLNDQKCNPCYASFFR